MTKPRIAYIGVGLMGLPMLERLLSLGYAVTAHDLQPQQNEAARAAGAQIAHSSAEATRSADLVLLNLPTPDAVESAVFGPAGVAGVAQAPQLLIDFSTIKVAQCRAFAARLREGTGCGWIDAPVSGGPPASASGTLTVMAGGDAADMARAAPLLADVCARCTHMGASGSGLVAKMINQLIVGCSHAMLAEALVLAEAAGIDAARMPDCLAGGYADSPLLQKFYPRMVAREFAPQGYARQMLKDLEMVNDLAAGLHAPLPATGLALQLYRMLIQQGHAELDTTALFKLYEQSGAQ